MLAPDEVAVSHYRRRQTLAEAVAQHAAQRWAELDTADIASSWMAQLPELTVALSGAQMAAAGMADGYLVDVLAAQGIAPATDLAVAARSFAGVASDGRGLASLLYQPAISTLTALASGATLPMALATGSATLDMIVRTQVADAGRVADGVALTGHRQVDGYTRLLSPPSCSRCVILAGAFYRWNRGFDRHPRCDCVHIPTQRGTAHALGINPDNYFQSLSKAEQDRVFTRAGAQAIRDGADLNQVVNARRGMTTTTIGRRKVRTTTEGTTVRALYGGYEIQPDGSLRRRAGDELESRRRGRRSIRAAKAPRLMPEEIYKQAGGDRDEAIRLLRKNGFLLGPARAPIVRHDPVADYRRRLAAARTGDDALATAPANTSVWDPRLRITSEQQQALRTYKGTGYESLNGALRRNNGQLPDSWAFEAWRDNARDIDAVMARSMLSADVEVWRGIGSGSSIFGADAWSRSLAGAEWTEHAYVSTTADRDIATDFWRRGGPSSQSGGGAMMRILASKGTRGIVLSDARYESEILLARGLRLRVVTDTGPGPNRLIELEIV